MRPLTHEIGWAGGTLRPQLAAADLAPSEPGARKRSAAAQPGFHDIVSRLAVLESAPVFYTMPESVLRALARRLRRIRVPSGEMVINQGEPGDTIFFIEQGRCRLVVERPPTPVTVAVLTVGDFVGEAATMSNRPQQASVFAQSECILLALDRQSLYAVLGTRHPSLIQELRRFAEQRFSLFADATNRATWGTLLNEATVVGVYSPKGGSGGTCISLNLVGALARRHPGEVLLLDLDFPYSHSALLAGLVPTSCLARMASVPEGSFEEALLSAVLYHSSGPMILPGALRPEEADEVTPELLTRAVTALRKTFRYIVVDLGVTISEATLALFDLTQHIVLVAAPELSAVKTAADAIDILMRLGTPHDRVTVVLNNRSIKPAVTRAAVERTLKRPVDIEVLFDGSKPEQAAVDGVILSLSDPRSEMTKGCDQLAATIAAKHGQAATGAGSPVASGRT